MKCGQYQQKHLKRNMITYQDNSNIIYRKLTIIRSSFRMNHMLIIGRNSGVMIVSETPSKLSEKLHLPVIIFPSFGLYTTQLPYSSFHFNMKIFSLSMGDWNLWLLNRWIFPRREIFDKFSRRTNKSIQDKKTGIWKIAWERGRTESYK